MARNTTRRRITRLRLGTEPRVEDDVLTTEEPLEIRVGGRALAVTMRTPGDDVDLAAGFLVSEGVIESIEQLGPIRYCGEAEGAYNVLDVTLAPGVPEPAPELERAFYTTSSCGLCGKASIDAVRTRSAHPVASDGARITAETLAGLPGLLRARQRVFEQTGGLHAAALFDADGRMLVLREDVGRHNAVDKVVGAALADGLVPARGRVLLVSGRASFELVQKASMAGIPILAAVSAPSSLAAELATEQGLTLVGFLRGETMVVYSGARRVAGAEGSDAGTREGDAA